MSKLRQARVQLLNEKTGEVEEEVDILTSADSVTFNDGETFEQKLAKGELKGPKGDVGPKGETGAIGPKGDTGPKGETGAIGPKGEPGAVGPKGETGAVGPKGADGSTWITGSGAPSNQGKTGDFYLNTANYDVYSKATGSWVKTGNIKGATGAQGPVGPTGPQGSQGPKGDPGDTIKVGASIETATQKKIFFKIV